MVIYDNNAMREKDESMANFVDTTVQDIDSRLKELQEEVVRLNAARQALVGPARRGRGRPRSSGASAGASAPRRAPRSRRARGRRRGATRATQALELVRSNPGITIPKIAESLKIEPNYLYRVMPKLVEDAVVKRDGLGYFPVQSGSKS
jgi:hypothetical protein